MTIWIEFPPGNETAIRAAYLAKLVAEDEEIGVPTLDATGTRAFVGSSRITLEQANELGVAHAPWLVVHETFPEDWQFAQ